MMLPYAIVDDQGHTAYELAAKLLPKPTPP